MGEEKAAPANEVRQPSIARRIGGFLSNIALLVIGAYVINWIMQSQFPSEPMADDLVGTRQFLSSTATVCGTLASFLLASLSFVMSSRGSVQFVAMIKRADFDIPMLGIAIVLLIYQAVACIYNLSILTEPDLVTGTDAEISLDDMVRQTMNGTITAISMLMLGIWSSVAPKVVNALVYGIGKVRIQ